VRGAAIICLDQLLPVGSPGKPGSDLPVGQSGKINRSNPGRVADCLVLQAVGFALPTPSPTPRCALTAPFHHCLLPEKSNSSAVYFLWRFPEGRPWWPLATTVALTCSDFPPRTYFEMPPGIRVSSFAAAEGLAPG